jgi:hypothetical protein
MGYVQSVTWLVMSHGWSALTLVAFGRGWSRVGALFVGFLILIWFVLSI